MRREGGSGLRVSQEGAARLKSFNPAEVDGEESQAGAGPQPLGPWGCSELTSFSNPHPAAQHRALPDTQTAAGFPGPRHGDNVGSLLLRTRGVSVQACSPATKCTRTE